MTAAMWNVVHHGRGHQDAMLSGCRRPQNSRRCCPIGGRTQQGPRLRTTQGLADWRRLMNWPHPAVRGY